ncbi:MAG: hypothetical protein EZS28_024511 [Streblomastix strix]|uniref:Uncharacterized protein n=1 Tax=Streblomastix strix TaxID=222440 RepID=A0A5J4VBY1_9EUKA|nr:MAG: hypothetical protein EZS28_024511 [Streblomastix strix]
MEYSDIEILLKLTEELLDLGADGVHAAIELNEKHQIIKRVDHAVKTSQGFIENNIINPIKETDNQYQISKNAHIILKKGAVKLLDILEKRNGKEERKQKKDKKEL